MKNEQPVLLILTPGFPENEADSTCLPSQQLFVKAINENFPGLGVVIVTLEYPFHRSRYQWHGNTVIPFNSWNKGKFNKLRIRLSVWMTLERLRRGKNIIGLFSFWCAEAAWMV